jgi:hypothetical protein
MDMGGADDTMRPTGPTKGHAMGIAGPSGLLARVIERESIATKRCYMIYVADAVVCEITCPNSAVAFRRGGCKS